MKYVRTKDGRILGYDYVTSIPIEFKVKQGFTKEQVLQELEEKSDVARVAETIEELCDGFIFKDTKANELHFLDKSDSISLLGAALFTETVRGYIETDKGLIYVAKMNESGEFELLSD